jgi:cysteine desulfurase/selenocysteine lyase
MLDCAPKPQPPSVYIQIMPSEALWEKYADQFPVREHLVYLNHAGVAPLCRKAAQAMRDLADDALAYGSWHYDRWLACYEGLRLSTAKMIDAKPSEIAIVKNTSEGISFIASGIQWRKSDIVVAFLEEFPSNYYPWKRLEPLGVEVRWLSVFDPLDKIDEACRGARLLAISFVQYLSGHRVDLNAIGEICARHGCLFFVDAIQGLGAFPLDVRAAKISALSADGHKWLLGPEGCGIMYIREDVQDQVEPVEFGWTNTAQFNDYSSRDMALRPNAGRYECGTLNTIGCFGLQASIDFLLEVGVDNIAQAVQQRADQIYRGVKEIGCEVLVERTPESGAGIVSFRKPGVACHLLMRHLKLQGFMAAPRQGWLRVSPHFYIAPQDAERLIEAVKTAPA